MVNFNQSLYHAYQETSTRPSGYELEYVQLLPTQIRAANGCSVYVGHPSDYPWGKFCQLANQQSSEPLYVKPFSKPLKGKLEEAIEWEPVDWHEKTFTVLGTVWQIKKADQVKYPVIEHVLGGRNKNDPTKFDRMTWFPLIETAWKDMLKQRSKIPVEVCPKTHCNLRSVTIVLNQGEITIFGENMPKMVLSNRAASGSRIMQFNLDIWPTFNFPPMEIGLSNDFLGFRRGREKWLIAPIKSK